MAKNIRVNTPIGVAKWPFLNKPNCKYDELGVYKVELVLPAKEAGPLVKQIKAVLEDAATSKKRHPEFPVRPELDDQGNKTGNVVLRCKSKVRETFDPKPAIFDAKGNKIDANIGGGSQLKLNLELYCWDSSNGWGMTLQPRAVQVIELVEFGGQSADSYGFEAEEGYVSEKETGASLNVNEDANATDEEEDDLF